MHAVPECLLLLIAICDSTSHMYCSLSLPIFYYGSSLIDLIRAVVTWSELGKQSKQNGVF